MTRKGLFDAMLKGCLPVLFHPLSASGMYTWHWPESLWEAVSVEIDMHAVISRRIDPVAYLAAMQRDTPQVVARKQALLRAHVFKLQYALDSWRDLELPGANSHAESQVGQETASAGGLNRLSAAEEAVVAGTPGQWRGSGAVAESPPTVQTQTQQTQTTTQKHTTTATPTRSHWPRDAAGRHLPDALERMLSLTLGWHSGHGEPDVRVARVTECWAGRPNRARTKCIPKNAEDTSLP
jgi:hypothetical protein